MRTKRLGDMLLELGLITEGQLKEALDYQAKEKERLGTTLIKHHYITEGQLIDALRMQLGIDYIDLTRVDISPELSRFVPKNLAKKMTIVPVRISKDQLYLAMADPLNFMAIEEAQHTSKKKIVPMIASEPAVKRAINILYGNEGAAEAMAQMQAETAAAQEVRQGQTAAREGQENVTPMIRLVNSIIERAISENASDIHFEPTEEEMVVRMRIDGQLHRIMTIPSELKDSVISRLKIMSQLDIVEKRIPQDGRAVMHLRGKDIDMRISTLPTLYGEKVVIRILKRNEETLNRRGIGIPAVEDAKIDTLLGLTSGVIMIVGPTGSGKSSTMYTLIRELLSDRTNLITLEDPVEYHIKGATQVQINEKVGLTFASGLRSVLRQDPDIICVGEIRDEIHRTDPAAEGARAQDRVEDEDDHGSGERGALREVSRKEALEKRERVRERNRPENERARKISRKELFPRDGPAPAGRSDEGEKHQNLHEVAGKTEAVSVQPFAPGLGGRQMTNFGLHGSTSWLR